jgi:hypothetical protein
MPERAISRDANPADLRPWPFGLLLVFQLLHDDHKDKLLIVIEEDVLQIEVFGR